MAFLHAAIFPNPTNLRSTKGMLCTHRSEKITFALTEKWLHVNDH